MDSEYTFFDAVSTLKGDITVPADKSMTHRAFMMAGMASGTSHVRNPLQSRDTLATLAAMKSLGVIVTPMKDGFSLMSRGYGEFSEPGDVIDCQNSGTTARLITGLLAPAGIYAVLTGDSSLRRRPMKRVIAPLSTMGANIRARKNDSLLPLTIIPTTMNASRIEAQTKSAQVKSAVLLAGLQIGGRTRYTELVQTRNHTEVMLESFGYSPTVEGLTVSIDGPVSLKAADITVPGDFSSAAFFIGAALMFKNADITITGVGMNRTRTGLLDVLKQLGVTYHADIDTGKGEPTGTISIRHQRFEGGTVEGAVIANAIDEVPLIATLGMFADSPITIRGAEELRVKESDRIDATVQNLRAMGATVEEFEDGMTVHPLETPAQAPRLKTFDDHRIAMIGVLLAKRFGPSVGVDDITPINVSFPDFIERLSTIEE